MIGIAFLSFVTSCILIEVFKWICRIRVSYALRNKLSAYDKTIFACGNPGKTNGIPQAMWKAARNTLAKQIISEYEGYYGTAVSLNEDMFAEQGAWKILGGLMNENIPASQNVTVPQGSNGGVVQQTAISAAPQQALSQHQHINEKAMWGAIALLYESCIDPNNKGMYDSSKIKAQTKNSLIQFINFRRGFSGSDKTKIPPMKELMKKSNKELGNLLQYVDMTV